MSKNNPLMSRKEEIDDQSSRELNTFVQNLLK